MNGVSGTTQARRTASSVRLPTFRQLLRQPSSVSRWPHSAGSCHQQCRRDAGWLPSLRLGVPGSQLRDRLMADVPYLGIPRPPRAARPHARPACIIAAVRFAHEASSDRAQGECTLAARARITHTRSIRVVQPPQRRNLCVQWRPRARSARSAAVRPPVPQPSPAHTRNSKSLDRFG